MSFEYLSGSGSGYSYSGGGFLLGFHRGFSRKVYGDFTFGGAFGSGKVEYAGEDEKVDYSGIYSQATVGVKLHVERTWFVAAYAGGGGGFTTLSSKRDYYFSSQTQAFVAPVGLFANFGEVTQVCPWIAATEVWRPKVRIEAQGESDLQETDSYVGLSGGLDVGSAKSGMYVGVLVQRTPSVGDNDAHDEVRVRFTWALKSGRIATAAQ